MTNSFYDQFSDYEAKPLKEVATPHANRQNLSQPYQGRDMQEKVNNNAR